MPHECRIPQKPEEGARGPGAAQWGYEELYEELKLSDLLGEQQVALTTEPSLHLLESPFLNDSLLIAVFKQDICSHSKFCSYKRGGNCGPFRVLYLLFPPSLSYQPSPSILAVMGPVMGVAVTPERCWHSPWQKWLSREQAEPRLRQLWSPVLI